MKPERLSSEVCGSTFAKLPKKDGNLNETRKDKFVKFVAQVFPGCQNIIYKTDSSILDNPQMWQFE